MPGLTIVAVNQKLIDRQTHILDAAARVFVRKGFHVTTMNEIASEAAMSPGNLYRYFSSKEAIIEGIAERDLTDIAANFAALEPGNGDVLGQFEALGRQQLVDEPREKAILNLEIWCESTRSENIARMRADIANALRQGFANAVVAAKASGELPADLDESRFAEAVFLMGDGLMSRRAVDPSYNAVAGADAMFSAMRILVQSLRK